MYACLNAILNGGTALFAALAAIAWFKAASAPLPWFSYGGQVSGDLASAANPDEFWASMQQNEGAMIGARWNRNAAIFAGVSAALQSAAFATGIWH